jgi:hypothetical protein
MKTITKDNIAVYLLEDTTYVEIKDDLTIIGNPPELYVSDCKSNNAEVFENVEVPNDWKGGRYIYENFEFKLNPNRIEEVIIPEVTIPEQNINQPITGLDEI